MGAQAYGIRVMQVPRVIARLDIKSPNLIKSIHLEGLRVVGDPLEHAIRYYQEGADELLYMDAVASLYERNTIVDLIKHTTQNVFVPITVGGGIRTLHDVEAVLKSGADKVAINTAAVKRPDFIEEVARTFGSQCMVLSIEAKKTAADSWEVYYDHGREKTSWDVMAWCDEAVSRGAGEILLTSIDQEGTRRGFDLALTSRVSERVNVPVIASGGAGSIPDITAVIVSGHAHGVALADVLHYQRLTLAEIKSGLREQGITVRQ